MAFSHPPHLDQDPLAAATAQRHALLQTQHLDLSEALASSPLWLSRKGHLSTHKIGNGKKIEYHLVICASSPWKDPPIFKNGKPSISIWVILNNHGYVSHNQRVIYHHPIVGNVTEPLALPGKRIPSILYKSPTNITHQGHQGYIHFKFNIPDT